MPRPRLDAAVCGCFDVFAPDLAEPNSVEGLGGHRNAAGSILYFATSSSAFSNAVAASLGVHPLASVLSSKAVMRRFTSGNSLAIGFFMILSPGGGMPQDHAVADEGVREPEPGKNLQGSMARSRSSSDTPVASNSADTRLRNCLCRPSGAKEADSIWSLMAARASPP